MCGRSKKVFADGGNDVLMVGARPNEMDLRLFITIKYLDTIVVLAEPYDRLDLSRPKRSEQK